ncbi:MAG: hypothetical protein WCP31_04105 [Chloroflexales bacterium]
MPVQLTLCRFCTRSRPDFLRAVAKLANTFPDDLIVQELDCIAACDEVPAIMVETNYYPHVTASELITLVCRHLDAPVPVCKA